jgi:hypothetical protein
LSPSRFLFHSPLLLGIALRGLHRLHRLNLPCAPR